MEKKNVKGIGFGIGIGVEDMLDGLLDFMTNKVGKKDEKGIYQNFTAITSWDANGGYSQRQKFVDGNKLIL